MCMKSGAHQERRSDGVGVGVRVGVEVGVRVNDGVKFGVGDFRASDGVGIWVGREAGLGLGLELWLGKLE